MLNCREVVERASDFLDARVPFHVRVQMRLHLLMCRFCREYIRQMSLVVQSLRRLPRQEPPAALTVELVEAFHTNRR